MKEKFTVTGMTCSACSAGIERTLKKMDGIKSVEVSLMGESMNVEYDEAIVSREAIGRRREGAGLRRDPLRRRRMENTEAANKYVKASLFYFFALSYPFDVFFHGRNGGAAAAFPDCQLYGAAHIDCTDYGRQFPFFHQRRQGPSQTGAQHGYPRGARLRGFLYL